MSADRSSASGEQRDGIDLTNLDQPLGPDAGATKRDLVNYLDAVADRILPGLVGRPLTVLRLLRGRAPFMQKNVPKYTPDWVRTVPMWAEASKRVVHYALCNDRRTLLWLANQRAIEYHPTLGLAPNVYRPTHLVLDLDPPADDEFAAVVAVAHLVRRALANCGLVGAVKTSGAKGVHVFVPVDDAAAVEDVAGATRALAARAEPRPGPRDHSSSCRTAAARYSSIRPGPAARRSPPRTARGCARGHRCPFRWTGPTSTESRLATSRCTRRSMHLPVATRGLSRCPPLSGCRTN